MRLSETGKFDMSLTLFFIVQPPQYQLMACYLAASLRQCLPHDVELVAYCPVDQMDALNPAVVETLRRMRCDVRMLDTHGKFSSPYAHGNKILASMQPRDTEFSGFIDSDVLMIKENKVENLIKPGHVSASVAASMHWAPQSMWTQIYKNVGLPLPSARITMMHDTSRRVLPYYSSGIVVFPEAHRNSAGQSFGETWYDIATKIDRMDRVINKRPYLDQLSLPLAIERAGLSWNPLPQEQHYILGGKLRGMPFPKEQNIYTVHYRKWEVLKENGLSEVGYESLRLEVGARSIGGIWDKPLPKGILPADHTDKIVANG